MQQAHSVTVYDSKGIEEISVIGKYTNGAIVRKRLHQETEQNEMITYLPNSRRSGSFLAVINSPEESDRVQLITMNQFHDTYNWNNPSSTSVLILVPRWKRSISEYTSHERHPITSESVVSQEPALLCLIHANFARHMIPKNSLPC